VSIFAGDAKMRQALVANSADFGLGSGPAMGFLVKGVPAKAVGVIAKQPLSMGIVVGRSSAIGVPEDLKGTKIGISTEGSLSQWLACELSRRMGWGSDGIQTIALYGLFIVKRFQSSDLSFFLIVAQVWLICWTWRCSL
jgi:NitT/TauT family transport system substrate-binding protein